MFVQDIFSTATWAWKIICVCMCFYIQCIHICINTHISCIPSLKRLRSSCLLPAIILTITTMNQYYPLLILQILFTNKYLQSSYNDFWSVHSTELDFSHRAFTQIRQTRHKHREGRLTYSVDEWVTSWHVHNTWHGGGKWDILNCLMQFHHRYQIYL